MELINKYLILSIMRKILNIAVAVVVLFAACNRVTPEPEPVPTPPEPEKMPIAITRAATSESEFQNGDMVGLYVVNYDGDFAGSLATNGNYVDNMRVTYYQGIWTPLQPIYWLDTDTKADFYCYYPYRDKITDISKFNVSVEEDQSSLGAYRTSDFLWGKVSGVKPTPEPVEVTLDHKMSRLVVSLVAGNGYSDSDLATAGVMICSVKTGAQINLATGVVSPTGNTSEVRPYADGEAFCACLVPQTISDADFVKINLGDRTYTLKQSLTLETGKQHKCTITVSKTDQGINVGISDWVIDNVDYGGIVE